MRGWYKQAEGLDLDMESVKQKIAESLGLTSLDSQTERAIEDAVSKRESQGTIDGDALTDIFNTVVETTEKLLSGQPMGRIEDFNARKIQRLPRGTFARRR